VITNLVSNAIKFTNQGEVGVRIDCTGFENGRASIRFEVKDSGIGIPADVQKRLFAPFQQADTSIARRFGGTGLGLSISRHLIELMGGQVELVSAPGKGTTVRFSLMMPVVDKAGSGTAGEVLPLRGRRVLVVDDRAVNREVIQAYFQDWGVSATGVGSASEGLEELLRADELGDPYSIVVVDMMMPEGNGLEFAHMVRSHTRLSSLKLMMLTSMSWKGDVRQARELGFSAFLTKPVHRDELLQAALQAVSGEGKAMTGGLRASDHAAAAESQAKIGACVLVAEDNPVNVEVAREYLAALGCEVTTVADGREAVAAYRAKRFDLVLMDCQMPEMDGLEATRRIRQLETEEGRPRTVVIAVTANAFAEDRDQCLEAGMDDYMSKPFSEAQLGEMLARWTLKATPAAAAVALPVGGGVPVLGEAAIPVDADEVEKALDLSPLRSMQKTHPSLAGRLVDTYLGYGPKAIQQMLAALVAKDIAQLKITAHSLKSSSANLGAMTLSGLCRELEMRMKMATEFDSEANIAAVAEIERAFQAVAVALGNVRDELKAAALTTVKARA
jgi:CheY-like chemotaxis protein